MPPANHQGTGVHRKIQPHHQQRLAYVYLRQSTPGQVHHHQESQLNQERMADRARQLGWPAEQVQLISEDLGKSGGGSQQRSGFRRLLADISLGKVGIVLCYEVSRLARNSADWHSLLEVATLFDTLIADYDGVYDLHQFNDRLLLGLKGTMSEAELHLMKLRLAAGRQRQLERGDYRQIRPTGLERIEDGVVIKDPDKQVRQVIDLVFATFARLRSLQSGVTVFSSGEHLTAATAATRTGCRDHRLEAADFQSLIQHPDQSSLCWCLCSWPEAAGQKPTAWQSAESTPTTSAHRVMGICPS